MTFYTYMMKNYKNADGMKGKLARNMHDDKEHFPKNGQSKFKGWHTLIRDYLIKEGASYTILDAFDDAWEEYELCERKRLNTSK